MEAVTEPRLGVVAIGRNEGERLRRCLESIAATNSEASLPVVYVDSNSTDDSVTLAQSLGATVVELDTSLPFTAARARNAGYHRLKECVPNLESVQFVDGDCEVVAGWLQTAQDHLHQHPDVAVVCGRRRERHPDKNRWQRLIDLEWDTPTGDSDACGGDAMVRAQAFAEAGGFRENLIAGEEPELCFRIRKRGHRVVRLDAEMTLHDAGLERWSQWWKRATRAGHAFAEVSYLHRKDADGPWRREVRSILFWGVLVPGTGLLAAWPTYGVSLGVAAGLGVLLFVRVRGYARARRWSERHSAMYARFTAIGKVPEAVGVLRYHLGRWLGRRSELIEYRAAVEPSRSTPHR